jgi:hypothetical protein
MQFVGGLAAGEDGWAPVKDAQYAVHLHHGRHTVHVRAQNTYGRAGAVSTVTFEVAPGVRAREGAAVLIQSVLRGRRDRRAGAGRLLAAAREAEAAHRKASRSAVPRTSSSASEGGYSVSHPVGSLDPEPWSGPRSIDLRWYFPMKVPPRTLEDAKPGRRAQVDIVATATTEEGHTTYEVELLLGGALQRVVTLARRGRRCHAAPVVMPHPPRPLGAVSGIPVWMTAWQAMAARAE